MSRVPSEQPDNLLGALTSVPDEELTKSAESAEGVNAGATVRPVYRHRHISCYTITETELRTLQLANSGVAVLGAIGASLATFWLDIFKDTVLAEEVPEQAQAALAYIQPALGVSAVAFFLAAGGIILWRRGFIAQIKRESREL